MSENIENEKKSLDLSGCRIVVSDLDGTLFNHSHRVSPFTKNVINKLREKGVIFSIATGRHYLDAKHTLDELGIQSILITSNGAMINDVDGSLLFQSTIDPKLVDMVTKTELPDGVHLHMYSPDAWFVASETEHMYEDFNSFHPSGFRYKLIPSSEFYLHPCVKIYATVYPSEDTSEIEKAKEIMDKIFHKDLHMTFSNRTTFELMSKGTNKGMAVEKLLDYEKLTKSQAIAFGDGMNDFEMLNTVYKGFIMENADPSLKIALPNLQIIDKNDKDGVANFINKYLL